MLMPVFFCPHACDDGAVVTADGQRPNGWTAWFAGVLLCENALAGRGACIGSDTQSYLNEYVATDSASWWRQLIH